MNWEDIIEWFGAVAVGVALALLLRRFVCLIARVKGNSMRDTLHDGDMLFALRRGLCGQLRRFDVVLCRYPGRKGLFVKRVVALPGERVALNAATLYIDGIAVAEAFPLRSCLRNMPELRLAEDEYFVLGDNRPSSHDSRSIGPIKDRAILAVAICIIFPPRRVRILRLHAGGGQE